ncbi:MAG: hypothetical protein AAF378_25010 [Cyanobacteria bacterium P01_A01_bin.84]
MGHGFANITVRGQTQNTLLNYLKKHQRNAYVSPKVNNFVVVYDEDSEFDLEKLSNLSLQISGDFSCVAFSIVTYDESWFAYDLYENGNLRDEYCSSGEDLFPEGGDAQKLCTILGAKSSINRIRPILREPTTETVYLFASQRHKNLVRELGLPTWSTYIIGGYRDIKEEEIDAVVFDEDGFPDVEATLSMLKNTND